MRIDILLEIMYSLSILFSVVMIVFFYFVYLPGRINEAIQHGTNDPRYLRLTRMWRWCLIPTLFVCATLLLYYFILGS